MHTMQQYLGQPISKGTQRELFFIQSLQNDINTAGSGFDALYDGREIYKSKGDDKGEHVSRGLDLLSQADAAKRAGALAKRYMTSQISNTDFLKEAVPQGRLLPFTLKEFKKFDRCAPV